MHELHASSSPPPPPPPPPPTTRDLQHTKPSSPPSSSRNSQSYLSQPSTISSTSDFTASLFHRPSVSNLSDASMPDSATSLSSQGEGNRVPYQTTERLADPFVESAPSNFKRPLTPNTNDRWRDDTVSATSSPLSAASGSPAQGSKRTASGQVKTVVQPVMATPSSRSRSQGHKRTSSAESALGNISQLSEQLKTRLSYAMVKVQNGWETCSIGQVENLASQLGSPASTSSPFRRSSKAALTSPRIAMANVNRRSRDLSQITSQMYPMSPPDPPKSLARRSLMQPPTMGPLSTSPTRAMDYHPSLAPPVSFDRSRRDASVQSDLSKSSSSRRSYPRPNTPTPQEQDAVDTLLFMSSPANSQFPHPTSTVHPSPLRSGTGWGPANNALHRPLPLHRPWMTRTGSNGSSGDDSIDAATATSGESRNTDHERQAKRRSYGLLKSNRDVDQLLDDMNDGSSEDEVASSARSHTHSTRGHLSEARPPAGVGHVDVRV